MISKYLLQLVSVIRKFLVTPFDYLGNFFKVEIFCGLFLGRKISAGQFLRIGKSVL